MPTILYGMQTLAQNARGVIVPNSGHWIPEEQATVRYKTARQFLWQKYY